ncbi:MAG: DUF1559 domain-containing protein [Planctomycetales bacterium]|nr:DUF1559 domain-containing protein [Planctomycetales bacterium]
MRAADDNPPSLQFSLRTFLIFVALVTCLLSVGIILANRAREQSRVNQCASSMRTIGISVLNYETVFRVFPAAAPSCTTEAWLSTGIENGQTCVGPNWAVKILGQLDEVTLARDLKRAIVPPLMSAVDFDNPELSRRIPAEFNCPASARGTLIHKSDRTQLHDLAKGNYAVCLGATTYVESIEGNEVVDALLSQTLGERNLNRERGICTVRMITRWRERDPNTRLTASKGDWLWALGTGTRVADISDGLSKTALLSEVNPIARGSSAMDDIRGAYMTASMGASTYSHRTLPNSDSPDCINGCDIHATGRMRCIEISQTGTSSGDTFAAARSGHEDGVNVAFGDASVRFIGDDVSPKVWRALATRSASD